MVYVGDGLLRLLLENHRGLAHGRSVPHWRFTLFFLPHCGHTSFAVAFNLLQAASKAKV